MLLSARTCWAEDDWLGSDRRAHFLGGLVVGGAFAAGTGSRIPGILVGCSVGAVGELIDARHGWHIKHVSAKDFAVGCLGATAGAFASVRIAPDRMVWSKQF